MAKRNDIVSSQMKIALPEGIWGLLKKSSSMGVRGVSVLGGMDEWIVDIYHKIFQLTIYQCSGWLLGRWHYYLQQTELKKCLEVLMCDTVCFFFKLDKKLIPLIFVLFFCENENTGWNYLKL